MFENEIEDVLYEDKKMKKMFKGAYAYDEKPKKPNSNTCFILNTEKRTQTGEHWLAIYLDENNKGYFFDSFGKHPSFYNLKNYMDQISTKWVWNKKEIQGFSDYCGIYCILFLFFKAHDLQKLFFQIFKLSSTENDRIIYKLLKKFR